MYFIGPPGYDLDGYHQMRPPQALQDNPVTSDVITGTWTELAQEELRRALQVRTTPMLQVRRWRVDNNNNNNNNSITGDAGSPHI